jgi:hypothetical protein
VTATVGAGKTFSIAAAIMEQKRLGLVTKAMWVVRGHCLAQAAREFLQLSRRYPLAEAASTRKSNREKAGFILPRALSGYRAGCTELARSNPVSCDGNRILPLGGCFGSEDPKRRPRDEMSLMVEGVVDGGMDVEKTLRGSRRLEPLHLALSPPHDLMGVARTTACCSSADSTIRVWSRLSA